MSQLARGLKKDVHDETLRQAKLLTLAIASAAPPRPKGSKGLAANIPNKRAKSVAGGIAAIVKGVNGMPLRQVAAANDPTVFTNSIRNGGAPNKEHTRTTSTKLATGAIMFSQKTNESPLWRIYRAAKTDPVRALKNLRQVLKNNTVQAPMIFNNFMGKAVEEYYNSLNKKSRKQPYPKVFINARKVTDERKQLLEQIKPTIGTVKAGWVQAGLQIPVRAGGRVPNWLLNKKVIGSTTANMNGMQLAVSLTNMKGNALGMNDRLDYVGKAVRFRTRKMVNGLREAIKAQLRKKYTRAKQPVPAHLAAGKPDDETEI